MNEGDVVKLTQFNGTTIAPLDCHAQDNYWSLIGSTGTIIQDPSTKTINAGWSAERRLLVLFDVNVREKGLHSHNQVQNALWMLESDLELQRQRQPNQAL